MKYLNDQSSLLPSQAASSQASSAREPLNSLTFPASRSAISLEPGLWLPSKDHLPAAKLAKCPTFP